MLCYLFGIIQACMITSYVAYLIIRQCICYFYCLHSHVYGCDLATGKN
uniref:Uncharacterized protein n=1 Tax=Arundo donax TaxID=35708 RepID=A0A0A9BH56_ARUDO